MKSFSFFKVSATLVAFAALLSVPTAQAANPGAGYQEGTAKIVSVKGQAQFIKDGKPQALAAGDTLGEKDTVITQGIGSEVVLDLGANGGDLHVIDDSHVVIETLQVKKTDADTVAETKLDLKKGGLLGNVKKLSKASNYEVKHAEGVAGIRGTKWAILPNQGVVCSEGTVQATFIVNGVALPPVTLGPGQMALPPGPGQTAPIVIDIPPAVATFLTNIFGPEGRGPGRGPGPHGRDIVVIVSAFAGADGTSTSNDGEQQSQE